MALFGIPGGAELLVLGLIVLLVFVPSLGLFAIGYMLGQRGRRGETAQGTDAATKDADDSDG